MHVRFEGCGLWKVGFGSMWPAQTQPGGGFASAKRHRGQLPYLGRFQPWFSLTIDDCVDITDTSALNIHSSGPKHVDSKVYLVYYW